MYRVIEARARACGLEPVEVRRRDGWAMVHVKKREVPGTLKTYKARGIVLNSLKYGDSAMVVHLLTDALGRQSYMVQGVRSSRDGVRNWRCSSRCSPSNSKG